MCRSLVFRLRNQYTIKSYYNNQTVNYSQIKYLFFAYYTHLALAPLIFFLGVDMQACRIGIGTKNYLLFIDALFLTIDSVIKTLFIARTKACLSACRQRSSKKFYYGDFFMFVTFRYTVMSSHHRSQITKANMKSCFLISWLDKKNIVGIFINIKSN